MCRQTNRKKSEIFQEICQRYNIKLSYEGLRPRMIKAKMSKFINFKNHVEFFSALKAEKFCSQMINDDTALLKIKTIKQWQTTIYLDKTFEIKFPEFGLTFLNVYVMEEKECSVAYCIVSLNLSQPVIRDCFKYLKASSCKELKLIIGPLIKDLVLCAKEIFDVEYTTSWFHLREIVKGVWVKNNLHKDENNLLSSALSLPLMPTNMILNACRYLQKISLKSKCIKEETFVKDIFTLFSTIFEIASVANTTSLRFNSIPTVCRKLVEKIMTSKTPGEMFAKIKDFVNTGNSSKKPFSSEVSRKSQDVWHKVLNTNARLEVDECIIILRNESKKFTTISRQSRAAIRISPIDENIINFLSSCTDKSVEYTCPTPEKEKNKNGMDEESSEEKSIIDDETVDEKIIIMYDNDNLNVEETNSAPDDENSDDSQSNAISDDDNDDGDDEKEDRIKISSDDNDEYLNDESDQYDAENLSRRLAISKKILYSHARVGETTKNLTKCPVTSLKISSSKTTKSPKNSPIILTKTNSLKEKTPSKQTKLTKKTFISPMTSDKTKSNNDKTSIPKKIFQQSPYVGRMTLDKIDSYKDNSSQKKTKLMQRTSISPITLVTTKSHKIETSALKTEKSTKKISLSPTIKTSTVGVQTDPIKKDSTTDRSSNYAIHRKILRELNHYQSTNRMRRSRSRSRSYSHERHNSRQRYSRSRHDSRYRPRSPSPRHYRSYKRS
ncbi:MATH and LRR domain-containing protein PFE0570w-like isoform X2 [Leptopilina boulardi]|uniref:MATH and LRR domain-containing protein PFE0570w-like isoform X2 n=1 Tax=Leptopilina boulardi TaxID=63433 RepID=UPI0021F52DFA|nr:MATH and LRR domain-containing protein PFE0570w-like isoform X2 [Leptopilina boulardi]